MRFHDFQIVLQEVPGEVSLCFSITGCELRCEGCHSPYLWKKGTGTELTEDYYMNTLNKYLGLASCVLFMGGEWHRERLVKFLIQAKMIGYKTCLYTGEERVEEEVLRHLDYLKTGKWVKEKGGLESVCRNQHFINVNTKENLNQVFNNSIAV